MQLYEAPSAQHNKRKRIGRGGKRGTTAGRGTKGQKSRAGRKIRPQERDLIIRIPKKRGFHNKPVAPGALVFNLGDIGRMFLSRGASSREVSPETLKAMGLIPMRFRGDIKILGGGDVTIPITLRGVKVSSSAKAKIEKAGGNVLFSGKKR